MVGTSIDNANCDGVRFSAKWSDVEITADNPTWTGLDAAVQYTAAHGKKCGLCVIAGHYSPGWLYAAPYNVVGYVLQDSFYTGTMPDITKPSYSAPTTGYLARWQKFVQAFAARYDSNPTVSFIVPSGIGADDQWSIDGLNDTAVLGNTTAKVDAWKTYARQVIDFFMAAFRHTRISGFASRAVQRDDTVQQRNARSRRPDSLDESSKRCCLQ